MSAIVLLPPGLPDPELGISRERIRAFPLSDFVDRREPILDERNALARSPFQISGNKPDPF